MKRKVAKPVIGSTGARVAVHWRPIGPRGDNDVKSPNCNIYKALFPEALRLEGLRLLKYQNDPEVVIKF